MGDKEASNDSPPVFSSWRGWYLLLIAVMVVLIVLFQLFKSTYS